MLYVFTCDWFECHYLALWHRERKSVSVPRLVLQYFMLPSCYSRIAIINAWIFWRQIRNSTYLFSCIRTVLFHQMQAHQRKCTDSLVSVCGDSIQCRLPIVTYSLLCRSKLNILFQKNYWKQIQVKKNHLELMKTLITNW